MDDRSYTIRLPKRWARVMLIAGITALIVVPLTAVATHTFVDVPDTQTFHDDIAWLEQSGVTKGCNPPANTEFCPDDSVSRGQMAAFLHRFSEGHSPRAAFNSDEEGDSTGGGKTLSAEITAPRDGILVMTGGMQTYEGFTVSDTLTCWLEVDGVKVSGSESVSTQEEEANNACTSTGAMVVSAGTHTVDLRGSGPIWYWDESVWVVWVPFDGSGMTP